MFLSDALSRPDVLGALLLLAGCAAFRKRSLGYPGAVALTLLTTAATTAVVLAGWFAVTSPPNAVAHLIQWNDAAGCLDCARASLLDAPPAPGCGLRPYYSLYLGGLMAAADSRFQIALPLQAAVAGFAIGIAASCIGRISGASLACAFAAALLVFAAQFVGTTLTENSGLVLGILAFAALWRAGDRATAPTLFAVFFVLGLAFNARPGAIFALPAILALFLFLAPASRWVRLARTTAGIGALVLAWAASGWLSSRLGGPDAVHQLNFAHMAYGNSVGATTYLQIYIDHPELAALQPEAFGPAALRLAIDNVLHRPHLFALGCLRGAAHYLYNLFAYVPFLPLRAVLILCWLVGIAVSLRHWRDGRARILLCAQAGVLTAAPMLTYYGGFRIFSVTYPVDALLVAQGAVALLRARRATAEYRLHTVDRFAWGAFTAAALPLAAMPAILAAPPLATISAAISCPPGQTPLIVDLGRDTSAVTLVSDGSEKFLPLRVDHTAFAKGLDVWIAHRDQLRALPAGTSLVQAGQRGIDGTGNGYRFLWPHPLPPEGRSEVCLAHLDSWLPVASRFEPLTDNRTASE